MLKTIKDYCTYKTHEKTLFYVGTIYVNLFVSYIVSIIITLYTFPKMLILFANSSFSVLIQKVAQVHLFAGIIFFTLDFLIFAPISKKRFLKINNSIKE